MTRISTSLAILALAPLLAACQTKGVHRPPVLVELSADIAQDLGTARGYRSLRVEAAPVTPSRKRELDQLSQAQRDAYFELGSGVRRNEPALEIWFDSASPDAVVISPADQTFWPPAFAEYEGVVIEDGDEPGLCFIADFPTGQGTPMELESIAMKDWKPKHPGGGLHVRIMRDPAGGGRLKLDMQRVDRATAQRWLDDAS